MPDPCPRCGALRTDANPAGLCPRCLMGNAMGSEADVTYSFVPDEPGRVLEILTHTMGPMPRVLLPDTGGGQLEPMVRPSSDEMPPQAERSSKVQLLGEIARGGMGAVLKGRDPDLGRDLAVKVLLDTHRGNPDLVRRFVEEAQIGGQLQHPGIVPVYELGTFGDSRPYFTMKLVKGRTLAELLSTRKSPLDDLPRLLGIFEQIAQTVAYAHSRGVIHRDLKPSNVMVGSFGEVQVMDWGLAKVLSRGGITDDASAGKVDHHETVIATARSESDSDLSRAGSVMGTPSYMAPEQARGEIDRVDERADVFALGSILCEILTGQPAFTGRNGGEIQRKAARGDLTSALASLGLGQIDAELSTLAIACLAPEADDRPRHSGEVAGRIDAYRTGVQERLRVAEIIQAEERARVEEAIKRTKVERDRLRLTVGLAAAILSIIGLGMADWSYFAQQKATRRAATERVVGDALDEAKIRWGKARASAIGDLAPWSDAIASADTARKLLEAEVEADPSLWNRVARLQVDLEAERTAAVERSVEADRDRKLIDRLEAVRHLEMQPATNWEEVADADYARAFREFGIDLDKLEPDFAGRRLAKRLRAKEIAYYLDDWALIRSEIEGTKEIGANERAWNRLIEVAKLADPDSWRNQLRSLIGRKDPGAVDRLVADEKTWSTQTPRGLLLLAQLLQSYNRREASEYVLKAAWRLRPDDFRICLELGTTSKDERLRFMTAALALDPETAWVRHLLVESYEENMSFSSTQVRTSHRTVTTPGTNLPQDQLVFDAFWGLIRPSHSVPGFSLSFRQIRPKMKKTILADLRWIVRLAPDQALYHMYLAQTLLWVEGKVDEALKEYREAFRLEPRNALFHYNAAMDLSAMGYPDRAIEEVEAAIRIEPKRDPETGDFLHSLASLRDRQSKPELAFDAYRSMYLERNIPAGRDHVPGNSFHMMTITGTPDQVVATLRERRKLDPEYRFNTLKLGEWLQATGKLEEAIALFQDLIRRNPDDAAEYQFGLGETLKAKGDTEGSEQAYREAVRRKPIVVAEILCRRGVDLWRKEKLDEAIAAYRRASEFAPPDSELVKGIATSLQDLEDQVTQAARLSVVLKGEDKPRNAAEGLAIATLCYRKGFYAAAARLWPDVFAADPSLANAHESVHRYNAACAAALAGSGQGKEEALPDESSREKLRNQAREWLRSDLILFGRQSETGTDEARKEVVVLLTHWKEDSDLAGVRDPEALAKLPEGERVAWRALWDEVEALRQKAETRRP